MLFSSPVFLVAFLPGVLALYYLIPRRFRAHCPAGGGREITVLNQERSV